MKQFDDGCPGARPSVRGSRSEVMMLYGAEVLSGAGDGIFWVALVVTLADEPRFGLLLLLAVLARLGPRAILGIAAGSLIDRSPLRRLLVSIDVLRGTLMIVLGLLNMLGLAPTRCRYRMERRRSGPRFGRRRHRVQTFPRRAGL